MRTENQKIKLLRVLEILRMYSDEEHPLSTNDIIRMLKEQGIDCARKSLYDDIKVLNEYGYEIMCVRSTQNLYYVTDRTFDIAELKILLDAVQAASFVTERKTRDLVCKIANLAGSHRADLLLENVVRFNTRKHTNESIFYSVDALDRAVLCKKKASFLYFDYDANGGRVFRRNKERYAVSPVALVFSDDNYYLIAYSDKYGDFSNFRVDRMEDVRLEDEDIPDIAAIKNFDVNSYKSQAFSMYGGETAEVAMLVSETMIDAVMDKFGEQTAFFGQGDGWYKIYVNVQLSPTFYGWCAIFGDKIKLLSPKSAVDGIKSALEQSFSAYCDKDN